MLDKAINVGAGFDWITPLWSMVQDIRRRPSVGYNVPVASGWSAIALRNLLREKGVQIWGLMIVQETITFRLRKAQAEYAQYWMDQSGICYAGGVVPGTQPANQAQRPSEQQAKRGVSRKAGASLDTLLDNINSAVGKINR